MTRIFRKAPLRSPLAYPTLLLLVLFAVVFATGWNSPVVDAAPTPAQTNSAANLVARLEFFDKKIRPVLAEHCLDCHSTQTRSAGGLRLDDRTALLTGGKSGPAINLEKPEESLILQRILSSDAKRRMPKGEDDPLPSENVADFKKWISEGAEWFSSSTTGGDGHSETGKGKGDDKPAAKSVKIAYPRPATAEQLAYFEKNVRPILVNNCYNCHSEAFKEAGGLRVDVGIAIFNGGNSGPAIIPGHPEKSLLLERVRSSDEKKRMPQESKEVLPADQIAILEHWIKDGAAWPDETEKLPQTPARIAANYIKLRKSWWSWQPLTMPAVPSVNNVGWSDKPIDRFILAKLEAKKLSPVGDADPVTLIRRVSYDLTGLPPTPAEVKAFVKDHSAQAYIQLVDRLLASPRYGERWGRHWLDVARYAESSGPSRNMPYPFAWRYRDYVIDAINRDVPYNRFLQEQVAGDLLPAATPAERDRLLIATGFLALGPKDVNQRFKARFKMDNVDDQIDTVTRSTMALTVSCARCHDHKFDPIPTTDYYALASIFTSTVDAAGLSSRMGGASLQYYEPKLLNYLSESAKATKVPDAAVSKLKDQVDAAKFALDAFNEKDAADFKANPNRPAQSDEYKHIHTELQKNFIHLSEELKLTNDLGELGYGIHGARDGEIIDTAVRIRGVEERHGPIVPRGFLSLISLSETPKVPADHSGRLELAQWITDPSNPLTARVYANRVWQHLFGTGLVSTVDNFGSTGDTPANPELLDYLAQDLIRNGWSTKHLVREILLTRAYQLGADTPKGYRDVDPADRLVWRHAPRRLEAEEIRDTILQSAGTLNLNPPHGSPTMALRVIEMRDDGPVVHSVLKAADRSPYRSIYLPQLRGEVPRPLAAFDPVTQTLVSGQREETTVPTQALFLLNSPFVREQSLLLSNDLLSDRHASDSDRIRTTFLRVLGREPGKPEIERVKSFIPHYAATWDKAHPAKAQLIAASLTAGKGKPQETPADVTDGIVRSDSLGQDDPDDTSKQFADETPPVVVPDTAQQAAWAAFVQSLYGSAEFQFAR